MSIEERDLKARVQALSPGDLVCCEWCDASTGKSSGSGTDIDVPVKSWHIHRSSGRESQAFGSCAEQFLLRRRPLRLRLHGDSAKLGY
jgi:hypothetical protein